MRRLALLLVFAIDACRTPTAMTVRVLSDVPCGAQRGVIVVAAAPGEYESAPATGRATRCSALGNGLYDMGSIVVSPSDDGSDRVGIRAVVGVSREAESCTVDNKFAGCIVARRVLRYLPHTELTLQLLLRQECADVACGPDTTCVGRVCRPAETDPERCKDGCGDEILGNGCDTPGKVECTGGKRVTCQPDRTLKVEDCGLSCSATTCLAATSALAIGASDETGAGTSCALVAGDVYCWGSNTFGRAGVAGSANVPAPTKVAGLPKIVEIAAAGTATQVYARDQVGGVWCWGLGMSGQCGAPELPQVAPRAMLDDKGVALTGVARVSTGSVFGCVLNGAKDVLCTGENGVAQLGNGIIGGKSAVPSPIGRTGWSGRAVDLACSTNTCCLIDDTGAVACWGNNDQGQTGTGSSDQRVASPARVALPSSARRLNAGDHTFCAVLEAGAVYCWGAAFRKVLIETTEAQRAPIRLVALDGKGVAMIVAGMPRGHYAQTASGDVLGWGTDGLHVGTVSLVPELTGATSISIASAHGCAIIAGGLQCWGDNGTGQLGDASAGHPFPAPVTWK